LDLGFGFEMTELQIIALAAFPPEADPRASTRFFPDRED
jgi:hypothetical protein